MCCCTLQDFQCIVYFVGCATEVPFWPFKIPKQPHNYIRSTSLKKFSKEDHHWKEKRWPEQFLSPGWYFVHPVVGYDNYPAASRLWCDVFLTWPNSLYTTIACLLHWLEIEVKRTPLFRFLTVSVTYSVFLLSSFWNISIALSFLKYYCFL